MCVTVCQCVVSVQIDRLSESESRAWGSGLLLVALPVALAEPPTCKPNYWLGNFQPLALELEPRSIEARLGQ